MDSLLRHLLSNDAPSAIGDLDAWWTGHGALAERFSDSIDVAIAGGRSADRVGYAFASGYQAAGGRLFGAEPELRPAALCATEKGSAHPSRMETALTRTDAGLRLTGEKSFVTFGTFARRLLVVATEGRGNDGRNRLRVVSLEQRDGVTITAHGPAPFVPEIPHASVTFEDVAIADEEVLPGDGYADYLKPFRTVEDIHVHGALLGYLVGVGRALWPEEIVAELIAATVAVRALASLDPSSPHGHIALGGAMRQIAGVLSRIEPHWASVDEAVRERWIRDRALLGVAGGARVKRLAAAWVAVR